MKSLSVWVSIAVIVISSIIGYWLFTLVASASTFDVASQTDAAATTRDGISGTTRETDNPVVSPLGSAAGGIVDVRGLTVGQVVARLDASVFGNLFADANGPALVAGSGKFTVFVPTDGAFSQFPKGMLSNMSATEKARLVQYHIVKGRAMDTDALNAGSVQAVSGDALNFNFGTNHIQMVGSAIVITQYNCANGVVYTIDNVLLPPKK